MYFQFRFTAVVYKSPIPKKPDAMSGQCGCAVTHNVWLLQQ